MTLRNIIACCLLALGANNMVAQQMIPVDEKVRTGKLDNGLTYYIRHNEEPKGQAAFYIAHKVGSVQEEDNQRGLAHFLEHMAFNGSNHFPSGDVFSFIRRIGVSEYNAETGWDFTYYHLDSTPVTNPLVVDSCLLLLSDWSCGVQLTQSEIDKERDVIHGEYRMRDNADFRLSAKLYPVVYAGSRYAERMPIGTMEVIDNFSPKFLQDYYTKWYHPDLQAVIIVGDVDVDKIEARVKELFGAFKNPADEAPYELYPVPDNEKAIYAIGSDKEQQNVILNYYFKREMTPYEVRGTVDYFVSNYVTTVACNIINERLADMVRKTDCPFLEAFVGDGQFLISKTAESFNVTVVPKPGQSKAATEVVMTELARTKQHGFTASEIERANERYKASIEQLYNNREKTNNGFFVNQYFQNFIQGNAMPSIETIYAIANQVVGNLDAEAFRSVLNAKTPGTEHNFIAMAQCPENDMPTEKDLKAGVEAGINAKTEAFVDEASCEPLISALPKPVKIKKEELAPFGFTKWSLKNGANVYFRKTDFSDNVITMNAFSKGGFNKMGDEYAPLQAIFFNPETRQELSLYDIVVSATGLDKFTYSQIKKKLAGKSVSMVSSISDDMESLEGSAVIKDLRSLFELTYLMFQGPTNDPDGYNSVCGTVKAMMPQLDAMHAVIQKDSMTNTYYLHNPHKQMLHASTLDKISYATVQNAHANRFSNAGDFDFVFTGPINEDSLRAFVEQYIAPMPGVKEREAFAGVKMAYAKGVVENTYPCKMQNADAAESIIDVRWTADLQSVELKQSVIGNALGSILGNRLFQKIREDGSMGYHAGANCNIFPGVHPILRVSASAYIKPECKDAALAIIYQEMEDIAKNGVTADELKKFVEPTITNYLQSLRNDGYWAYVLCYKLLYDYDIDTDMEAIVKGITSDDIKAMVNDIILKQNNRTTVVMIPEL